MKFIRSLRLAFIGVVIAGLAFGQAVLAAAVVIGWNAAVGGGLPMAPLALGATGLTNLVPDAYAALAVVSRELTGLLNSVNRLPGVERLGIGQSLRSAAAPINTAGRDIVPAMTLPAAAEQTIGNVPFVLTKSRAFPFTWSGEDQLLANAGPGALTISQQQIAQAMRAAVAEISADGYAAAAEAVAGGEGSQANPFAHASVRRSSGQAGLGPKNKGILV
jgi:hypothetical protein